MEDWNIIPNFAHSYNKNKIFMVSKSKQHGADIVLDKDGKDLSTQPNQITDLHMVPTLYTERAMDELVLALQPFYAAAKRKENKAKEPTQLMLNFGNDDAYLVTPDKVNSLQQEGDFVATIRFRDLPGITPKHYAELRQVLMSMKNINAEVHTKDGVLYTNFIDIIQEYDTHEVTDPKTGEKFTVRSNDLKRNEVKIRIRKEILENSFFLTDSGYTQFYFPTTRHTKTATANRMYKWLSKWRGIKKNQITEHEEQLPDGTTRTFGNIVFRADYKEVRAICGLFYSQDGKIVNGEDVETLAVKMAKNEGKQWDRVSKAEQKQFIEQARQKASEKYAYYSEFAKRYLAQAKKELDNLTANNIADFTFDYRPIFADGKLKGKTPLQVEFTLIIYDLGQQLYKSKDLAVSEKKMRDMMKQSLDISSEQASAFIRRLQPGDHEYLQNKLERLIDINSRKPRADVQHWAVRSLNTFFTKELPTLRGTKLVEVVATSTEPKQHIVSEMEEF